MQQEQTITLILPLAIGEQISMRGKWQEQGFNWGYYSTARRAMARFGLLMLAKGK